MIFYHEVPNIVILEYPMKTIHTSHTLEFLTDKGDKQILQLRGIVYHGRYHFTSRIISSEQDIWFHDWINTGKMCPKDRIVVNLTNDHLRGRDLVLAVYASKH